MHPFHDIVTIFPILKTYMFIITTIHTKRIFTFCTSFYILNKFNMIFHFLFPLSFSKHSNGTQLWGQSTQGGQSRPEGLTAPQQHADYSYRYKEALRALAPNSLLASTPIASLQAGR